MNKNDYPDRPPTRPATPIGQIDPSKLPKSGATGPLAWLYSLWALVKSFFYPLPELDNAPEPDPDRPYTVIAWRDTGDGIQIAGFRSTHDPGSVDEIIADAHTAYRGARLTFSAPDGVAMRLDRRMRRAALSRVKRKLRRADRRDAGELAMTRRRDREERDRARAERISAQGLSARWLARIDAQRALA